MFCDVLCDMGLETKCADVLYGWSNRKAGFVSCYGEKKEAKESNESRTVHFIPIVSMHFFLPAVKPLDQ